MNVIALFPAILLVLAFLTIFGWTLRNRMPPMPSTMRAQRAISTAVRHILSEIDPTEKENVSKSTLSRAPVITEAGCGWGTLLRTLSRDFPRARITGFENSPIPCLYAKLITCIRKRENVKVVYGDFMQTNFLKADIIVCYLMPKAMDKIENKICTEEAGKTKYIISNTFQFQGWAPDRKYPVGDIYNSNIYVYKIFLV